MTRTGGAVETRRRRGARRWAAVLSLAALLAGCAADVGGVEGDEDVAGASEELVVSRLGNPDFICDYRLSMSVRDARGFPYCADADLTGETTDWTMYRRLIIAQHGRGGNAASYLTYLRNAEQWASSPGVRLIQPRETFVVAPQFISQAEVNDQGLAPWQLEELIWWQNTSNASWDWATAGLSSPGMAYSSFSVLDRLIELAIARMPNLTEIIFTGQSAGGQTTQKYAMLNDLELPPGVSIRYLPANPYAYTYPLPHRPLVTDDGTFSWSVPDPDAGPYAWPDLEVCSDLAGQPMEAEYDTWEKGLLDLPQHYLGPDADSLANTIRWRYAARDVTYIVGEADVTHEEQCGEAIQAQGRHRRERARAYHQMMNVFGADHGLAVVPDQSHGGTIYNRECTRRVLFGGADSCEELEDYVGLAGWSADVVAMAFGNVDDDVADELAIVLESAGYNRLFILDDEAHGHALLYNPTTALGWPSDDVVTDIAFGRIDGGREELVVGRRSETSPAFTILKFYPSMFELVHGETGWNAQAVAFGDIDDDGTVEIGVTRDATSGTRWFVYDYVGGSLSLVRSGSWSGTARPNGIAFGDVDGDGQDELAVGTNRLSGARLHLYDGLQSLFTIRSDVGAGWPLWTRLVDFGFGDFDKDDAPVELVVARRGTGSRWQLLDDRLAGFAVLEEGGQDWDPTSQPTALAVGRPSRHSFMTSIAIGRSGPVGDKVELYTYRQLDEPTHGQVRRVGSDLSETARIGALAFGDVDGHRGGELAYGIANDPALGYLFGVLASP